MSAAADVEIWVDYASTYSYLAAARIDALATGRTIVWKPFVLGPIFQKQGWNDSPFNLQAAKGSYMWRDLERSCARYGLPFVRPSSFPRNSVLAARIGLIAAEKGWCSAFSRAVFHAGFAEDRDIGDPGVLRALVDELGRSGRDVLTRSESPDQKPLLRRQTERAQQLGIFGAPSFVVGGELFWGNDRLEEALAWAAPRS